MAASLQCRRRPARAGHWPPERAGRRALYVQPTERRGGFDHRVRYNIRGLLARECGTRLHVLNGIGKLELTWVGVGTAPLRRVDRFVRPFTVVSSAGTASAPCVRGSSGTSFA